MAKLGDNPNSATSEWFFSLEDNSANLDNQNAGFTVFGKVLGKGLVRAQSIAALPAFNLGGALTNCPIINYKSGQQLTTDNLVAVKSVSTASSGARAPNAKTFHAPSQTAHSLGIGFATPQACLS